MKILECGDIQGHELYDSQGNRGFPVDEGNYIAFAIGPDSVIADCLVDGLPLGVGQILPLRSQRPLVRPRRAPANNGSVEGAGTLIDVSAQVVNRLQLIAWECGETPHPVGPRPPGLHPLARFTFLGTDGSFAPAAGTIPFQGRRVAKIHLCIDDVTGGALTYPIPVSVFGQTNRAHAQIVAERRQAVDTGQQSVLLGTFNLTATDTPAVYYVGGTNDGEAFDQVALTIAPAGGVGTAFCSGIVETFDAGAGQW